MVDIDGYEILGLFSTQYTKKRPTSGQSRGLGCRMIGASGVSRTFCHGPLWDVAGLWFGD